MTLRAAILSTGDELTTGRIADTNASWIADKLFEMGIDVVAILAVGDYPDRLVWAWTKAIAQADVVISTGGIGPTADDLTTETVSEVLGLPLVLDQPSVDRMRAFFASRGIDMPENNVKQARLPEGATIESRASAGSTAPATSSSSPDSLMPKVWKVHTSGGSSPASWRSQGRTVSSIIGFISRGTPGRTTRFFWPCVTR